MPQSRCFGESVCSHSPMLWVQLGCHLSECLQGNSNDGNNSQVETEPTLIRGEQPRGNVQTDALPSMRRQGIAVLLSKCLASLKANKCSSCVAVLTSDPGSNSPDAVFLNSLSEEGLLFPSQKLVTTFQQCMSRFNSSIKMEIQKTLATLLIKQRCRYANRLSKVGVFKRTRQVLAGAVKDGDGIRQEEDVHQLHPHDLSLLFGSLGGSS